MKIDMKMETKMMPKGKMPSERREWLHRQLDSLIDDKETGFAMIFSEKKTLGANAESGIKLDGAIIAHATSKLTALASIFRGMNVTSVEVMRALLMVNEEGAVITNDNET